MKLLGLSNAKTIKGEKTQGVLTGILYLVPAKLKDTLASYDHDFIVDEKTANKDLCPSRSEGCTSACLFTAGRGRMTPVLKARTKKTLMFHQEREKFLTILKDDIGKLQRKAQRAGLIPAVRLNGTSDIKWHKIAPSLFTDFPEVRFYDYTKHPVSTWPSIANYDITFSRSEVNDFHVLEALKAGKRAAIVFDKVPDTYKGFAVIDGDEDDVRFNDPQGVIIGLKAKGLARKDTSGFVV